MLTTVDNMCIYVDNYVDNREDFKSCVILYMRIIRVKYVLNKRKQVVFVNEFTSLQQRSCLERF